MIGYHPWGGSIYRSVNFGARICNEIGCIKPDYTLRRFDYVKITTKTERKIAAAH